ncbi:MAG: class I SAM-dependent methyltransferase [Planctomycetaceae bacterium]|nr:class I SAM-dependent methyltransferase [Planctomycetaceae bacterium]
MSERPVWQRDEFQQINTDFADAAVVEGYETWMGKFRDLAAEDAAILDRLALARGARLLEIGTGTGHFAIAAAQAGLQVTAVDVSEKMLQYAEQKARSKQSIDVAFRHAGFLTFAVPPATFDAAVSMAVLHHLPDLWKAVALANVRRALKPGGLFLLGDVVFSSQQSDPRWQFDAYVEAMPSAMRDRVCGHLAKEFSTLDWIMEGLLTRAGFQIQSITIAGTAMIHYLCKADG